MALLVNHQQSSTFKHLCKVCKKGFGCGRALGGHMRAHGIGEESGHMDDEDPASDWEDKLEANEPPNKRMYALRTNPNRLKTCRVCENCGKEFLSWKSFLEHGKCSSEDAESPVSSPGSDGEDGTRKGCGWSKRKRSLRAKVGNFSSTYPSSEEEDLANCLMMLSNAAVDPSVAEPEESCASASREEERRNPMNNFMPPIAHRPPVDKAKGVANKGLFECKACKKVFNSHQALGGHRASHKKVKGCFAARLDQGLDDSIADEDVITHEEFFPTTKSTSSTLQFDQGSNPPLPASPSKRKSKVHECSICHRVFSSGQALGGHKRCHWITSNSPDPSTLAKFQQFQDHMEQIQQRPKFIDNNETLDLTLDLNLPAPVAHHDDPEGARLEHPAAANPSSFGVSTGIYLQSWIEVDGKEKDESHPQQKHEQNDHRHHHHQDKKEIEDVKMENCINGSSKKNLQSEDDEADSKVKLAKLSELKDINMNGSSSPWLQVGIGSTADVGADP